MKGPTRPQGVEGDERNTPGVLTDAELVDRLRARDSRAFETLFARYFDMLVRFAYYIVGSRDGAKDVVQDVFVRIWEQADVLAPRSVKQYLYTAVRNRALDERKHESVRTHHQETTRASAEADASLLETPSPEDAILNKATIQAAIRKLSDRRQQVLRLRLEEQLTHAEIGEVLGISTVAASHLVIRALEDLQKVLGVAS